MWNKGKIILLLSAMLPTGELIVTEGTVNSLQNEIARFQPVEWLIPISLAVNSDLIQILQKNNVFITKFDDRHYGKILLQMSS